MTTNSTLPDTLREVFDTWCQMTGQDILYQPCERQLYEFVSLGFTKDDLRSVLTFMLWSNKKREPKYRDRMLFHRIVGDTELFNSRLGESRCWLRNSNPTPTNRDKVLALTGREPVAVDKVRRVSEVFKSLGEQQL